MKILIASYSKGGSTHKVADTLKKYLVLDGHEVDTESIKPVKDHSFWYWFLIRIFKNKTDIQLPKIVDVSEYDLIFVGSPNWTRLSLPVVSYLEMVDGLHYKNVALFSTTYFVPFVEWYFFSAYLLDATFSQILQKRNARNLGQLLLSSGFKRWSVDSLWGDKKLRLFIKKVTTASQSLKEYLINNQDRQRLRLFVVLLPLLMTVMLGILYVFQGSIQNEAFQLGSALIIATAVIALFLQLTVLGLSEISSLGKYIAGSWLGCVWVIVDLFSQNHVEQEILGGYIVMLTLSSIFREPLVVLITGINQLLGLVAIAVLFSSDITIVHTDLLVISISLLTILLVTKNLKNNTMNLLDIQEDLDNGRLQLEMNYTKLQSVTQEIKKEKNKTATILAHLSDGVLVFDSHKNLIYANQQAINYLTNSNEESHPVGSLELEVLKNDQNMQKLFMLVKESISYKEISFDNEHTYEVSIEPIQLEESGPFVIMADLHDITERKQLEEMKVDFASIAAHELRTPITTIRGYLALLEEEVMDSLDECHVTFLKRAIDGAVRLNATVESLLAVTRVERGQTAMHTESINIIPLITETISELTPAAADKRQKILFTEPHDFVPNILADELKIKEILVNLINNAIKYTQSEGTIEVLIDQSDRYVQVHVKDNGPGIPEKTQKYLFRKFTRGDNPLTEQTQGVGLGLYLVKSLVELQNGNIWVNSVPCRGTTFSFSIPKDLNEK